MSKIEELIERLCPNGVKYRKIEDVAIIKRGDRITKRDLKEEGSYKVISGGVEPMGYYDKYNRDEKTITISSYGYAGYVSFIEEKFWANDVCLCVFPNDIVNNKYLYYSLKNMQEYFFSKTTKAIPDHIPTEIIKETCIPVPPLEVQCKIVHILDDFTLLSAELSAELKARQSQYNFYKDKIFNISEKTNYVEIKDILQEKGYIRGPFGSALRKSDMVKNGVPIYEQQHAIYNHRNFRYFISNEKANNLSRFMVKEGDIILSCSGTVGRTSIIKSADEKGVINQALLILRIDSNKINVRFLEHFLNSSYGKKKILSNTNGSAQVNICKREEFEKIKIPLPKIDEQNKIVNILDRFDKLCNDISEGLPAEIESRQKQYEYYRDKLLTFKELKVNE